MTDFIDKIDYLDYKEAIFQNAKIRFFKGAQTFLDYNKGDLWKSKNRINP